MSAKKPTVILGADVSALNVARSLGRRGIPVFVIGGNRKDYAAASKYTTFVMCEDLNDENSVLKVLQDIAKTVSRKMVLMATADLHVLHMSRNRDDLAKDYCFVLPAEGTIETLMDKKKFARYAVSHDFKVPETYYSSSSKQLERISRKVSYPCVVKPLYRTEYWSRCVPPEKKVMKAATATELTDVVQSLGASDESLVVQEWIPGGDEDVHFCLAYLDRSEKPLALFTGRKLRQYPSLTGVTSLAESRSNQELENMAVKLLTHARCRGLCSVEFKRSTADGSFTITEPTVGRVDLQEGVSTCSGIDIPFIAYLDAIGEKQELSNGYADGVVWINEPFELNSFLVRRQTNGRSSAQFFIHYRGKRTYALLAKDDPGPFFHFLAAAGRRGTRYAKKAVTGRF
jgi:predicted ATP-grasp superfamily ATP-dependent carboligase